MVTPSSQNKFITREGRFFFHTIIFSFFFYKEFHSFVNFIFEENYKNSQLLQFFALIFLLVASSLCSTNNKEISKHVTLIDSSARILRILLNNIYKNIYIFWVCFHCGHCTIWFSMPSGLANYCHFRCETSFCCFVNTLQFLWKPFFLIFQLRIP